jgi:hypothetical protein
MVGKKGMIIVRQENGNHRMSENNWMQRYAFKDMHEIFFG